MEASGRHPFVRPRRVTTYTAYSVGCAVAWAVLWAIAPPPRQSPWVISSGPSLDGWGLDIGDDRASRLPASRKGHAVGSTSDLGTEFACPLVAYARGDVTMRLCLSQRSAGEHRAGCCVRGTFGALLRREPPSDWGWI
jgi:hypothetical protein